MKKLLFILALLLGFSVQAQNYSFGITGRLGAFKTLESSSKPAGESIKYGIGLQAEFGAWVQVPVTAKGSFQATVLQTAARQKAGEIPFYDERGNAVTDAAVADYNLAVALQAGYLYKLSDVWSIGTGAGAKYEYLSKGRIKGEVSVYRPGNPNSPSEKYKESFRNLHRRSLTLHLPMEVQRSIGDQLVLVGQLQVPLNNRIAASESAFKERDLGLTVGVNYTLK